MYVIYVWVESKVDHVELLCVILCTQSEDGLFIELPLIAADTD